MSSIAVETAEVIGSSPVSTGVNLYFIESFIAKYKISKTMTTGDVVEKIIKPETLEQRTTYVERVIKYQQAKRGSAMFSGLRQGSRNKTWIGQEAKCFFLSHTWQMPFVLLVESIRNFHKRDNYNDLTMSYKRKNYFYWIDVFCKNQHFQAPAMDEFKSTMCDAGQLVIALWPRDPVALTRIWCLFELYTAIDNSLPIFASFPDEDRRNILRQFQNSQYSSVSPSLNYNVNVENATARFIEDVDLIMGIINKSLTASRMNIIISDYLRDSLNKQFFSESAHMRCETTLFGTMAAASVVVLFPLPVYAAVRLGFYVRNKLDKNTQF